MNNNINRTIHMNNYQQQQGAALAVGLILLLIITLMGYTGMKGTMLQEKMAAGLHNRSLAHSGANSALREGEEYLYKLIEITNGVTPVPTPNGGPFKIYSLYSTPGDPESGLNPNVENFTKKDFLSTVGTEHSFPFFAVTEAGAALQDQPEYLINHLECPGPIVTGTQEFGTGSGSANDGVEEQTCYVVTGKSTSGDGKSISLVQSMYTVVASSNPSQ